MYVRDNKDLYFSFNDQDIKEAEFLEDSDLDYVIESLNLFMDEDDIMKQLGFSSKYIICPDCFGEFIDEGNNKSEINCTLCGSINNVVPWSDKKDYPNYPFKFKGVELLCRERCIAIFERHRTCEYTVARLNKMIEIGKIVDIL